MKYRCLQGRLHTVLVSVLLAALLCSSRAAAAQDPGLSPDAPAQEAASTVQTEIFVEDFSEITHKAYADRADWNTYNRTLTILPTSGGAHREPVIAPDGRGGAYVVWQDLRNNQSNGDWDIYAQRLDSRGNRLWPQDRRVNSDPGKTFQGASSVVVDSEGNALIGWIDDRTEAVIKSVYLQKLAPDGTKLWAQDVRANSASSYRLGWGIGSLALAIDSQDNVAAIWQGIWDGNWADPDIHMQKISSQGERMWGTEVVVNHDIGHRQTSLAVAIGGQDEIIVAWVDERNNGQDIYAQWLTTDGAAIWPEDIKISAGTGVPLQGDPSIVADDTGNATIIWRSGPADPPLDSGVSAILAQRVSRSGVLSWPTNVRVNDDDNHFFRGHPSAAFGPDDQVLVLWEDTRRGFELGTVDVFAQFLTPDGTRLWPGDRRINPETWRNWNLKPRVQIAGAISWIAWNTDDDAFAQVLDLTTLQTKLPLPALANEADGKMDQVDADISRLDNNRLLVAWEEPSRNNWDIRAQVINALGQMLWPTGVRVNDPDVAIKRQRLRLATNSALRSLLVWHDEQGGIYGQLISEYGVRLWQQDRRFDAGSHRAYNPAVAALIDGTFVVAWIEERATDNNLWDVYLQRVDTTGTSLWPANLQVNQGTYSISEMDARSCPEVAVDAQGHIVITWRGEVTGQADLFMRRFAPNGVADWDQDLDVKAGLFPLSSRFQDRTFAVLAGSEITIASTSQQSDQFGLYVQRFSLDGHRSWASGTWVSAYTTPTFAGNPSLAATDDGGVVVVWDEEPGQRNAYAQRLGPLGDLRWPTKLNLNQALAWPLHPKVSPLMGDGFVAVWNDERSGDNSIYARRFSADGILLWDHDITLIAHEFFYNRVGQVESTTIASSQAPIGVATLIANQSLGGGSISYYLSNNGGQTWDEVVPGQSHRFGTQGDDLRWRAILQSSTDGSRTPIVNEIRIHYGPEEAKDFFEPDDVCNKANAIAPDGSFQPHTFHVAGDTDWIRFNAAGLARYAIAAIHTGDLADVEVEIYDACNNPDPLQSADNFGKDTTLVWSAPEDGTYYLRLTNHTPTEAGPEASYRINVRLVAIGAAIIAGGRLYAPEELQTQITFMTDRAYQAFRGAGYDDDAIYYLSADPSGPSHMDAPSVPNTLAYAIRTWAPQHLSDGAPLFIYLADHGARELFYLDTSSNTVSTDQVNDWLLAFEHRCPHSPVVIIIEACYSGSLISLPQSLSRPNRIIITAADDSSNAIAKPIGQGGAYFSDPFFDALAANFDLWTSFQMAYRAAYKLQSPWLDANGNGLAYPADPADEGAGHHLGLGRLLGFSGQAPFIESSLLPAVARHGMMRIEVRVLDEDAPRIKLWAEVSKPSTPPPSPPPGSTTPVSHATQITLTYNLETDRFETNYDFAEDGQYEFLFQAEDVGGLRSQPVRATLQVGEGVVYLPLVLWSGKE